MYCKVHYYAELRTGSRTDDKNDKKKIKQTHNKPNLYVNKVFSYRILHETTH